jgi:hypothetical protein
MNVDESFLKNNCKKAYIQRENFKKIKPNKNLIVKDPYTGDPWEYNEEITKLFDDMIVNKKTT